MDKALESVLADYHKSFVAKAFGEESTEEDHLMRVFGLTQAVKAGNKQYWGRELGMCLQRLVVELFKSTRSPDFAPGIREGADEICDLVVGKDAIDTKYRIGSGDSGTLKKFKQYGARIRALGYRPVLLILRCDNLGAAIGACTTGGYTVLCGDESYSYIAEMSGFDLKRWLIEREGAFPVTTPTPGLADERSR